MHDSKRHLVSAMMGVLAATFMVSAAWAQAKPKAKPEAAPSANAPVKAVGPAVALPEPPPRIQSIRPDYTPGHRRYPVRPSSVMPAQAKPFTKRVYIEGVGDGMVRVRMPHRRGTKPVYGLFSHGRMSWRQIQKFVGQLVDVELLTDGSGNLLIMNIERPKQ